MNKNFIRLSAVFASIYFFSLNGLAALPNLSLHFILKEQMKVSAAGLAYFQALTLVAWVIKPLWGFISDSFPLGGLKRKPYLLITSAIALIGWLGLVQTQTLTLPFLLAMISITYMAYAFQDVASDGLMVDEGKRLNKVGEFQSIQWCAVYSAMILTAFGGGYISDLVRKGALSSNFLFLITSSFPLITLLICFFFIREERVTTISSKIEWKEIWTSKDIWLIAFFLFLWNFSPSFGSAFFYYAVDTLKFTGSFLGILQAVTSIGALIGSICFGQWIVKIPIRKFFIFIIFIGIGAILFHGIYFIPFFIQHLKLLKILALATNFILGALSAMVFLQLFNLCAKVCPKNASATTFALLMSFYNLGLMGSSALGGFLFPLIGLKMLIIASAFCSLLVLPLLPFLPIAEELTPLEKAIKTWIKPAKSN